MSDDPVELIDGQVPPPPSVSPPSTPLITCWCPPRLVNWISMTPVDKVNNAHYQPIVRPAPRVRKLSSMIAKKKKNNKKKKSRMKKSGPKNYSSSPVKCTLECLTETLGCRHASYARALHYRDEGIKHHSFQRISMAINSFTMSIKWFMQAIATETDPELLQVSKNKINIMKAIMMSYGPAITSMAITTSKASMERRSLGIDGKK